MQQIVNFLIKNRNVLLYLFLVAVGLTFTVQNHSYHRNSFIHSSGSITGSILDTRTSIFSYFNLKDENELLREENAALRMQILTVGDSLLGNATTELNGASVPFEIYPARIVKNSYTNRDNFITIDIGEKQGIEEDMGVITTNGIIGVVDRVGSNYSRVISVLNSEISLNAQIKGSSIIGSLVWDGNDPYTMNLIDVPRLATVKKGDTIVTGRQSLTFPHNINIGVIQNAQLTDNGGRYLIKVRLLNDMTNIGTAYVIRNRDLKAIQEIDIMNIDE